MRLIFLTAFLTVCTTASAQDSGRPVFTQGLEWGETFNCYGYSYLLYLTGDQYLAESNTNGWTSHVNGFAGYHAGVALRRMEVLCGVGYQGFNKNIRMFQTGLQANVHRHESREGVFGFLEGCLGLPIMSHNRMVAYCAAGMGFRTRLSRRICLDYKLGLSNALTSPREVSDPYSGNMLDPGQIRESRSRVIGLRFSTALIL